MVSTSNTNIHFWGHIWVRGQLRIHSDVINCTGLRPTTPQRHDYWSGLLEKGWANCQWKQFDFSRINLRAYPHQPEGILTEPAIENSGLAPKAELYVWGMLNISANLPSQTEFSQQELVRLGKIGELSHHLDGIVLKMVEDWKLDEQLGLTPNQTVNRLVPYRNGLLEDEFEALKDVVNENLPDWQFSSFDTGDVNFALKPLN